MTVVSPPALRLHGFLDRLCDVGPEEDFRALCADALSYHEDVADLDKRVQNVMVKALEQNDEWARKCAALGEALAFYRERWDGGLRAIEALAAAEETPDGH